MAKIPTSTDAKRAVCKIRIGIRFRMIRDDSLDAVDRIGDQTDHDGGGL